MKHIIKNYKILWENGLHARPVSIIFEYLSTLKLDCINATVRRPNGSKETASMTSIINLILLSCPSGSVIRVEISGDDWVKAVKFLDTIFSFKNENDLYTHFSKKDFIHE